MALPLVIDDDASPEVEEATGFEESWGLPGGLVVDVCMESAGLN